jgi:hypothetical protein
MEYSKKVKGLSINTLISETVSLGIVVDSSENVEMLGSRKSKSSKGRNTILYQLRTVDNDKEVRTCAVMARDSNSKPIWKQFVMVSCDCEFFKFNNEYALTYYHASFIKHSNGQPPHVTNPNLVPHVCKHLLVALSDIKRKKL